MRKSALFVAAASVSLALGVPALGQGGFAPQEFIFVDQSVTGPGSGAQNDPYKSLDDAIAHATSNWDSHILIAAGTYVPNEPHGSAHVENTFLLDGFMFLIGGWDGAPTGWPPTVDPGQNPVTLSGDQGGGTFSYHVLTSPATGNPVRSVEGVTVRDGKAAGGGVDARGGGLLVVESEVTALNCTFEANEALAAGGAVYNAGGDLYVFDSILQNNEALVGGAIANGDSGLSSAAGGYIEVWDSLVRENVAAGDKVIGAGGGLYTGATEEEARNESYVFNSQFIANETNGGGGAVFVEGAPGSGWKSGHTLAYTTRFISNTADRGGGVYIGASNNSSDSTQVVVVNCGFCRNKASSILAGGGGVYVEDSAGCGDAISEVSVSVTNCTFAENEADATFGTGAAIHTGSCAVTVSNTIVWGNTPSADQIRNPSTNPPTVQYSNVQGGWSGPGSNNLNTDPEYNFQPADCDCEILNTSPMIDAGLQSFLPLDAFDVNGNSNTTERLPDLVLNPRVVGDEVDIGAREVQNP